MNVVIIASDICMLTLCTRKASSEGTHRRHEAHDMRESVRGQIGLQMVRSARPPCVMYHSRTSAAIIQAVSTDTVLDQCDQFQERMPSLPGSNCGAFPSPPPPMLPSSLLRLDGAPPCGCLCPTSGRGWGSPRPPLCCQRSALSAAACSRRAQHQRCYARDQSRCSGNISSCPSLATSDHTRDHAQLDFMAP